MVNFVNATHPWCQIKITMKKQCSKPFNSSRGVAFVYRKASTLTCPYPGRFRIFFFMPPTFFCCIYLFSLFSLNCSNTIQHRCGVIMKIKFHFWFSIDLSEISSLGSWFLLILQISVYLKLWTPENFLKRFTFNCE